MTYIKRLIAFILSWFKASEPEPEAPRTTAKHKKHVHLRVPERRALYRDYAAGEAPGDLALKYNVSSSTVYRIVHDYDSGTLKMYREVA